MGGGPVRRCVACRTARPQRELLRVVASPRGPVLVHSRRGRVPGRGAYVCPARGCVERAVRSGALARALRSRAALPDGLVTELLRAAEAEERERGKDG